MTRGGDLAGFPPPDGQSLTDERQRRVGTPLAHQRQSQLRECLRDPWVVGRMEGPPDGQSPLCEGDRLVGSSIHAHQGGYGHEDLCYPLALLAEEGVRPTFSGLFAARLPCAPERDGTRVIPTIVLVFMVLQAINWNVGVFASPTAVTTFSLMAAFVSFDRSEPHDNTMHMLQVPGGFQRRSSHGHALERVVSMVGPGT